jgi:hypothetical protein
VSSGHRRRGSRRNGGSDVVKQTDHRRAGDRAEAPPGPRWPPLGPAGLRGRGRRRLGQTRITRRTLTDLPQLLTGTTTLHAAADPDADASGAVSQLEPAERQLDGSGQIATAADPLPVSAGALVWLPSRSQRAILAGPDGLTYLSVHRAGPA